MRMSTRLLKKFVKLLGRLALGQGTVGYFPDYVQRSCSSLYRLLRFTNCPI